MKYIISVTQKDIEKGRVSDASSCPVALALKRKFPRKKVSVYFYINIGKESMPTPKRVFRWIDRFDGGFRVKPFQFQIDDRKLNKVN